MKTYNNLYPKICTYENLYNAWCKTRKGKRFTGEGSRFEFNLERELQLLQQQLSERTYKPGEYRSFYVYEPKKRMISAAPLRDRVAHHAVCNIIEPIFEPSFICDSYANRKGKGTHKAILRYQYFCRMKKYVLKCDIKKFFPSIDLEILKTLYRKKISCKNTQWLLDTIIDGSNTQEEVLEYFSNDVLFTPYERRRGLPIGNLTSQFFANVYLNELDHFVKEELRQKAYIRYVDDFVLFGKDKKELNGIKNSIQQFLVQLRLTLNLQKSFVHPLHEGIQYLGFRVFPVFRLLENKNCIRFKKRMEQKQKEYRMCNISLEQVRSSVHGWIGHVRHCNSYRLRSVYLNMYSFQTG